MKKNLSIFFLSIASIAFSQQTFEKQYYNLDVYSVGITMAPDSSFLIVANDSLYKRLFHIIKTDKDGVFQWMKTDSSSRTNSYFYHTFGNSFFTPAGNGNFIVGEIRRDSIFHGTTSIMKFDTSGNIVWNKTYSKPNILSSINQTIDSGFILLGSGPDTVVGGLHYSSWISKIDSSGNVMWTKGYQFEMIEIIQTDDGGYLLAGSQSFAKLDATGDTVRAFQIPNRLIYGGGTLKSVRINPNAYVFTYYNYLMLVDSMGHLLWDRVIPIGWWLYDERSIIDVARLNDTTILLFGVKLIISPSPYISKIDLAGHTTEQKVYERGEKIAPYSIFPFDDGRLLISSTMDETQWWIYSLLLIKTDTMGYTDCGFDYGGSPDSMRVDTVSALSLNYVTGSNSFISDSLISYITYNAGEFTRCSQITGGSETSEEFLQFNIFPNPSGNTFRVKCISPDKNIILQILNPIGQVLYTKQLIGKNEYVINTNLSPGIYLVKVTDQKQEMVQKLIIE